MPAAAPPASLPAGGLLQLMLSLVLVIGVIFAVSWLLKRLNLATPRASRAMQVLDELALGPRERILLVRIGDAQLLLGVASNGITALTPLAHSIDVPHRDQDASFAARLKSFMPRTKDPT